MRSVTHELRLSIEQHPWRTLVVSFCLGVLVTFLFPEGATKSRSAVPGFKEGFLLVLGTAKLLDPAGDLGLSGSRVQLVRHWSSGETMRPCVIPHPPLLFSANERNATLSGTFEDLESTILSLTPDDLKHVDLSVPQDPLVAPCTNKVKIVYGQEG